MASEKREPKVVVLGGGSWGTTVASICARRGPTLQWVRSEETATDINDNHRNSRYLGNDVVLSDTLRATTDFAEAANSADVVVMGVPSHGFRAVLSELAKELRPWVPVVSLVKGLEQGTNMRMSQIIEETLPGHPAGILAGPNIAREVGEGYAAAAVLAMPDQHLATRLSGLFRTRRFRVYTTDEIKEILIPRATMTTSGANFEVLVGFEVTPEMAAFNREGKRFRPNVAPTVASQDTTKKQ